MGGGEKEQVSYQDLREALRPLLSVEALARLDGVAGGVEYLLPERLDPAGLRVRLAPEDLSVRARVPPGLRPTRLVHGVRRRGAPPADAMAPAPVSGFVNLRGSALAEQNSGGAHEEDGQASADAALAVAGFVLEGSGDYASQRDESWRRGDLRLLRDFPDSAVRAMAGDLVYAGRGFQTLSPLLGVSVARTFALQPWRVTEPRGQASLFLRSRSEVDVYVNGMRTRHLELEPGPYELRDFAASAGASDVRLRVTDAYGRVEERVLSLVFDDAQLAPGLHEFGVTLGVRTDEGAAGRTYRLEDPALSAYHRRGMDHQLTLGTNLQLTRFARMGGVEWVSAGRPGIISAHVALSHHDGEEADWGSMLQYRWVGTRSGGSLAKSAVISAGWRGPRFGAPLLESQRGSLALDATARYNQEVMRGLTAGCGLRYSWLRELPDSGAAEIFTSWRFARNWHVSVSFNRSEGSGGSEWAARAQLGWSPRRSRHSLTSSFDSRRTRGAVDWSYRADPAVGGIGAQARVAGSEDSYDGVARAQYRGTRAEAELSHVSSAPTGSPTSFRTRASLGTALAFAGTRVGLSRPIGSAFAILAPHPSLSGQKIGVDRIAQGAWRARIDGLGPAVVPDLVPYQPRRLTLDASDLPIARELGEEEVLVAPTYKSGVAIEVGTAASIAVRMQLHGPDGRPLILVAGEVVRTDGADHVAGERLVYTNREGRLEAPGLTAGAWELRLFDPRYGTVPIVIPEEATGILELPPVTVPERPAGPDHHEVQG